MPAEALLLTLLNIPVFMFGVLLAKRVIDAKNVDERRRLEEEMTRKVRLRYRAYLELEQQVERIFKRLDFMETETDATLNQTRVHLKQLEGVVAAVETGEVVEEQLETSANGEEVGTEFQESLGWMDDAFDGELETGATTGMTTSASSDEPESYPAGIEEWQTKLESVREEKRQEIERLGLVIADLTKRVEGLTKGAPQGRLDRELQLWQQKYMNLERASTSEVAEILNLREDSESLKEKMIEVEGRVEEWKQKHADLEERATRRESELEARVTELEPHVEAAEFARKEASQWSTRCEEETKKREQEVAACEKRIAELEPMRSTISSMESDRAALQQSLSNRDGQIRDLAGRLEEARERVGSMEGNDANQRAEIARLEERLRSVQASLTEQQNSAAHWKGECESVTANYETECERTKSLESARQELSTELSTLRGEHDAACERLKETETSLGKVRAELAELELHFESTVSENDASHQATLSELEAAQSACDELQSKYDMTLETSQTLERELENMRTSNENLRKNLDRTSADVEGQTSRISSLMADLDGARREVETKSSLVHAAEVVLSELKPKLEALENQLSHEDSGKQD